VRTVRFFKYWLPVIVWMAIIFGASTNLGAPRNTSRIIAPILRLLNPNITDETIGKVQYGIRKTGHAVEYAILALLIWRARRKTILPEPKTWHRRDAIVAILVSALYAATDEFHQSFVSTRQASVWDVILDTAGAVMGIFLLWIIGRRLKYW
jgi:VanZ family protein